MSQHIPKINHFYEYNYIYIVELLILDDRKPLFSEVELVAEELGRTDSDIPH